MASLQVTSSNTVEDFESVADKVRTKIETYFSQLLGIIRKRQTELISELNEILSRYRQERVALMNRVKELEEIRKYHKDRNSKDQLNDTLNKMKIDLAEALNASTNTISVKFECNSVYASQASKIGKLTQITKNNVTTAVKNVTTSDVTLHDVTYICDSNPSSPVDSIDSELYSYVTPFSQTITPVARSNRSEYKQSVSSPKLLTDFSKQFYFEPVTDTPTKRNDKIIEIKKETNNDVTMTGTDCSLFIFSQRLYEGLIYRTDVGPMPRYNYREEHLSSDFANYPNWKVAIEGCYWCGKPTRANQYTYVCGKKCYSLLHEWCRRKLYEFCGESLCMYPGCEQAAVESANCCSDKHLYKLETRFKTIYSSNMNTMVARDPQWYNRHDTVSCSNPSAVSPIKVKRSFPAKSSPDIPQLFNKKVCQFPAQQSVSYTSNTRPSLSYDTLTANESLIHKREVDRSKYPPPFNPDFINKTS